ncbi:hypothetical protein LDENG_00126660 [Lucifuga dentata]|nr:hypothetical protein LDENG_00126660 [Lucifuga dentata]
MKNELLPGISTPQQIPLPLITPIHRSHPSDRGPGVAVVDSERCGLEDVELKTRKDEQGIPYKTFSYININISDAELKKCLTVLNKSKWKGGTLQIEAAKQSFLHRLAEERHAALQQHLQPAASVDVKQKVLESLSRAGVENFTMKSAVPGTEVPGHKNWVVSKFGRVLPVLQLRSQRGSRARTLRYDPSKYCHNIRRLNPLNADQPTPVTQLTWEIQAGDDDISKKRRGEFPPYQPARPKRSRTDAVISHDAADSSRCEQNDGQTAAHQRNRFEPSTMLKQTNRKRGCVTDSDVDSEEEIHRLVAAQQNSHGALGQEVDKDTVEVVGLDYTVKSRGFHQQQKGQPDGEDEDDYDSADTDELLAFRKHPPLPPPKEKTTLQTATDASANNTAQMKKAKKKRKAEKQEGEEGKCDTSGTDELHTSRILHPKMQKEDSRKQDFDTQSSCSTTHAPQEKITGLPVVKLPSSESESDEDDDGGDELESADSDSDYEALFSNVTRLEISLDDLRKIAEDTKQTSETTPPSIQNTQTGSRLTPTKAPKKGTTPEEILAAILEEDSSEDVRKKKPRKCVVSAPLPAFQGTGGLTGGPAGDAKRETEEEEEEDEAGEGSVGEKQRLQTLNPLNRQRNPRTEEDTSDSSEEEEEGKELKEMAAPEAFNSLKLVNAQTSSSSRSGEEEEEEEPKAGKETTTKRQPSSSSSSSSSSTDEDKDDDNIFTGDSVKAGESSSSEEEEEEEKEEERASPRVLLGGEDEEQQRKANLRRLAAIQQRQEEAEQHRKLIQGALANLDTSAAGTGKHIVFGSDDDDDDDDDGGNKQQATSEVRTSKKTLFQISQSDDKDKDDEATRVREKAEVKENVHVKLFDSSEDEEHGDEEEDGSRFDVRPQFEGRAGQKLMELQTRFGTDERFRMDSRFLEEEEEEEDEEEELERKRNVSEEDEGLEEERRTNLSILQSVLSCSQLTSQQTSSNKTKTFRDVSVLHYDPSREEHAAFETKTDKTKKESKAARRKKREEAQKLPEVSKDIYYDVSVDLKTVFGPTKDYVSREEKTSWDQEEEEEEEGGDRDEEQTPPSALFTTDPSAEKEESSGFKFSFFGDDTAAGGTDTVEYRVETIQGPKVSWHQDPRFHDSSSEEEEEQEEDQEPCSAATDTAEEKTPSKRDVFFFYPEDDRLTDGPRLFCCSSQLEEQREQWEERRSVLRQEYRKKHRDARRKLKSSQRS